LGKTLDLLTVAQMQSVEKKFVSDVLKIFNLKRALDRRKLPGAPGTSEVRVQLAKWRKRLKQD